MRIGLPAKKKHRYLGFADLSTLVWQIQHDSSEYLQHRDVRPGRCPDFAGLIRVAKSPRSRSEHEARYEVVIIVSNVGGVDVELAWMRTPLERFPFAVLDAGR
jgi:hypothetical protein